MIAGGTFSGYILHGRRQYIHKYYTTSVIHLCHISTSSGFDFISMQLTV